MCLGLDTRDHMVSTCVTTAVDAATVDTRKPLQGATQVLLDALIALESRGEKATEEAWRDEFRKHSKDASNFARSRKALVSSGYVEQLGNVYKSISYEEYSSGSSADSSDDE